MKIRPNFKVFRNWGKYCPNCVYKTNKKKDVLSAKVTHCPSCNGVWVCIGFAEGVGKRQGYEEGEEE